MATYQLITDPIKLNDFRFHKVNETLNPLYNTHTFDNASYVNTLLFWQLKDKFYHRKLFIDTCTVYINTQANFPGSGALPYPDLDVLDCNKNFVATLSVLPFIKGAQQVSGNTIYNPNTGSDVQANTYCWEFKFQDVVTTNGIYYLRIRNTASDGITFADYISEPIIVYGNSAEVFPNTVLIEGYNLSNNAYMGYLRGGWDNALFYPIFRHRVSAYITEFDPKDIYISMLQQDYEETKLNVNGYRSFRLELEQAPDFEHEKINEILKTDVWQIDGKRYKRDASDSETGVKAYWNGSKPQTANKRWVSIGIREETNDQHIFFEEVENPCFCPDFLGVSIILGGFTYSMAFRFDLPSGLPCPFVIEVTTPFSSTNFYINSLSDFTSNVGSVYTKGAVIGGFPDIAYRIITATGTVCAEGTATYEPCSAPTLIGAELIYNEFDERFEIRTTYSDCGEDCHVVSWTYTQTVPGSGDPDSGAFGDDVDCPPEGGGYLHTVEPDGATPEDNVSYSLTWGDCCGNTGVLTVSYEPECEAPSQGVTMEMINSGGTTPRLRIILDSYGGTCHTIGVYISMTSPLVIPEAYTLVTAFATLPVSQRLINAPTGGLTSGTLEYNVRTVDCCGVEVNTPLTVDLDCDLVGPVPDQPTSEIVESMGSYSIHVKFTDCGETDCATIYNILAAQQNTVLSGVNDGVIVASEAIPCGMGFPYTLVIPITPNLDVSGTELTYSVSWLSCCDRFNAISVSYTLP